MHGGVGCWNNRWAEIWRWISLPARLVGMWAIDVWCSASSSVQQRCCYPKHWECYHRCLSCGETPGPHLIAAHCGWLDMMTQWWLKGRGGSGLDQKLCLAKAWWVKAAYVLVVCFTHPWCVWPVMIPKFGSRQNHGMFVWFCINPNNDVFYLFLM